MGEYAAFVISGALSLGDALVLIARRAQLMVTKCALNKSGMVACKLSIKVALNEIAQVFGGSERLVIACDNSPEDCVVAGDIDDLTTFLEHCKATGIKAIKLQVPFGFHSPAMEPLMDSLRRLCSDVSMTEGNIPIISSHLGKIVQPELLTADYLANHTRHTVNFTEAIQDLASFAGGQKLRVLEIGHTTGS
jgi:acyl transferase domain-containing protein